MPQTSASSSKNPSKKTRIDRAKPPSAQTNQKSSSSSSFMDNSARPSGLIGYAALVSTTLPCKVLVWKGTHYTLPGDNQVEIVHRSDCCILRLEVGEAVALDPGLVHGGFGRKHFSPDSSEDDGLTTVHVDFCELCSAVSESDEPPVSSSSSEIDLKDSIIESSSNAIRVCEECRAQHATVRCHFYGEVKNVKAGSSAFASRLSGRKGDINVLQCTSEDCAINCVAPDWVGPPLLSSKDYAENNGETNENKPRILFGDIVKDGFAVLKLGDSCKVSLADIARLPRETCWGNVFNPRNKSSKGRRLQLNLQEYTNGRNSSAVRKCISAMANAEKSITPFFLSAVGSGTDVAMTGNDPVVLKTQEGTLHQLPHRDWPRSLLRWDEVPAFCRKRIRPEKF
jgi:hypothetical protein